MGVAGVSDIHSNLHALEAVLAAIEAETPDELWCLGDLVGYGARPNECCAIVAERVDVCLAGNHDLAVRGTIDLEEFGGGAGGAAPLAARPPGATGAGAPRRARALRSRPRRRPLPRVGARPDLGVRSE